MTFSLAIFQSFNWFVSSIFDKYKPILNKYLKVVFSYLRVYIIAKNFLKSAKNVFFTLFIIVQHFGWQTNKERTWLPTTAPRAKLLTVQNLGKR